MNKAWKQTACGAAAVGAFLGLCVFVARVNKDVARADVENVSQETVTVTRRGYGVSPSTFSLRPGEKLSIAVGSQESRLDPRHAFEMEVKTPSSAKTVIFTVSDVRLASMNGRAVIVVDSDAAAIATRSLP